MNSLQPVEEDPLGVHLIGKESDDKNDEDIASQTIEETK